MNKAKRILTTTGYTTQLEKSIVLSYIEELEQKVNQLETKIKVYENPEDMTQMFKWCDEIKSNCVYEEFLSKKQELERGKE